MDDMISYTGNDNPGFTAFMRRVNKVIIRKSGMGVFDFADAMWRDLYDETEGKASDRDIIDTLAEADDIFGQLIGLDGGPID